MLGTMLGAVGLKGKVFKFNFNVIGFALVFTLAAALIMGLVANEMKNSDVPSLVVATPRIISVVAWGSFALVLAYVVFGIAVNVANKLKDAVKIEDQVEEVEAEVIDIKKAQEIMPQYSNVIRNGQQLTLALREIANSRASAKNRASDAREMAGALAALVKGAVQRANQIDEETDRLRSAISAVRSRDAVAMNYYIGALNDSTLVSLIETALARDDMVQGVLESFAAETGALEAQSMAILSMAKAWVDILKSARAELARIDTTVLELGAATDIVQIDSSLTMAVDALRLSTSTPIAVAVAEVGLPTVEGTPRHNFATGRISHPESRYIGAPQ